ncbi:class IV adenylate cyclase [Aeoliella mucimassa]|uniref:CYTH domain protein n=1 Tax=Aeoliella mucimassa TaxID=2527972 RepID=A0A518AIZ3_9BACT|nr:class IV adenylate cyclase [Aeoliella mucimassa]QDU54697.1 CYTH domain protein [Aeoliella mucimassa]
MQLEIEQKFAIADPVAVVERVVQLGGQELSPVEQRDTYYNHPSRDFRTTDEALRIRRTNENTVVTYKGPKLDTQVKTRPEIEIPLAQAESWPPLLEILGFREVATVSKRRRRFALAREGFDIEVAVDEVTNVGNYAEVEIVADETQVSDARQVVQTLASELQLQDVEPRSYLSMLLAKQVD